MSEMEKLQELEIEWRNWREAVVMALHQASLQDTTGLRVAREGIAMMEAVSALFMTQAVVVAEEGLEELAKAVTPLVQFKDDYDRGKLDAVLDANENVPFASVGGMGKRLNMQVPEYGKKPGGIPIGDPEVYLKGYRDSCKAMWGAGWETATFSWKPVLEITEGGIVPVKTEYLPGTSAVEYWVDRLTGGQEWHYVEEAGGVLAFADMCIQSGCNCDPEAEDPEADLCLRCEALRLWNALEGR